MSRLSSALPYFGGRPRNPCSSAPSLLVARRSCIFRLGASMRLTLASLARLRSSPPYVGTGRLLELQAYFLRFGASRYFFWIAGSFHPSHDVLAVDTVLPRKPAESVYAGEVVFQSPSLELKGVLPHPSRLLSVSHCPPCCPPSGAFQIKSCKVPPTATPVKPS